ncbi:DUF6660 family protein [Flavimarina sp. Hel_I_48]|uniref:DUF6660 family protein n=1 Tax=Flavimarina sp. Hel_I_48 TaxID=1392488 RepID=UPI00068D0C62
MKNLALLFSIYLLGLNVVLCEDNRITLPADSNMQEITQDTQHLPADSDNCSPFCQCQCCHVHVVNFYATPFKAVGPAISTLIIQKGGGPGVEIPYIQFQPPRV